MRPVNKTTNDCHWFEYWGLFRFVRKLKLLVMKRSFFGFKAAVYFGLIMVSLLSCQKETVQPGTIAPTATVSSESSHGMAVSNNLVPQTFTRNGRTYHFYCQPNGRVDSIVATGDHPYVYRVVYKGSHLDSVILVDRGRIVSTHRNFQYKGELITGYDYFDRIDKVPYPWSLSVSYDAQKRIVAIDRKFQGKVQTHKEWIYNVNDDVVNTINSSGGDGSYTYDSGLNPLHMVRDLFALFVEEPFIWEYCFSLHNMVSKAIPGGLTITYINEYNGLGQLIRQSLSDHTTSFAFTYQ
jgi:hypothetical protein